jgi:hypothetical protein
MVISSGLCVIVCVGLFQAPALRERLAGLFLVVAPPFAEGQQLLADGCGVPVFLLGVEVEFVQAQPAQVSKGAVVGIKTTHIRQFFEGFFE